MVRSRSDVVPTDCDTGTQFRFGIDERRIRHTSSGGYYASSYPTAHTIYCADDSERRQLSPTYLVHLRT